MSRPRPRGAARPLIAPALALVLTAWPATAAADPGPSTHDVEQSRQAVRARAAEVGRIQARLAAADARLRDLSDRAEIAIERYNGEIVKLDQARAAYQRAQRTLASAEAAVAVARDDVARLAALTYRAAAATPTVAVLVSGDGPQGFTDRAALAQLLARRHSDVLTRLAVSRQVAQVLRRQASRALAAQRRATRAAASAKQAAETAVARQRQAVQQITTEKRHMLLLLARAETHAVHLARERATALARARQAAAQRAAARRAARDVPSSSGSSKGDLAADWALTQLGKPYVWAAAGPSSYDCSGLTMRAWQRAGVQLDHWTGTQWTSGPHIPLNRLHRGDLLFFGHLSDDPGTVHHVGIYIGDGRMVEAPFTGSVVRVSSIWRSDLVGATRPS